MQGKGIVKFFLVVMTLVCLVQWLFILPTQKVEKNAEKYASQVAQDYPEEERKAVKKVYRTKFLDSMSNENIFSIPLMKKFTYQELKSRQLALGLDLKGGMSVVLQVDLRDFLRALANDSKDPTFLKALENATKAQASAQSDYVTLFADEFRALAEGKTTLARIFASSPNLRDQIDYQSSEGAVVSVIREKANETVKRTFERLKRRIDEFGVTQPNVSLDAARDLIIVELPGIDNPERARNFLQATANLEFWEVFRITDPGMIEAFVKADQQLAKFAKGDTSIVDEAEIQIDTFVEYGVVYDSVSGGFVTDSSDKRTTYDTIKQGDEIAGESGPLMEVFTPNGAGGQLTNSQAVMGTAKRNQMERVIEFLERPEIKRFFPESSSLEWRWSADPMEDFNSGKELDAYELYAIKKRRGRDEALLDGEHITRAYSSPDPQSGEVQVSMKMDGEGAKIWRDMTTKAANDKNREIAIVLDEKVVSAPRVNGPIPSGDSQITGNFSVQEGQDLASILEIGKLPAKTKIIQESLVGPSLGAKNINRSMKALLIGFSIVLVFMILYYGGGGIVSIIALLMNLFFIFGSLASYGTVLTLPGIAGIVLTIGMAVDANVIIYERIREELREGKTMLMAINDGFKHSYSAIIDANVTTILTAFVLAYFGLGPIKGFAVVLIIGVLCSLFTAVLIGRLMIDWWTNRGNNISFWTKWSENAFANLNIDWLSKRRMAYGISGVIIFVGIVSFFARGFEFGVDFKGGYSYNIEFDKSQPVDAQSLRVALEESFGSNPIVKAVDVENTYNVTTSYLINSESERAIDTVMMKLHAGVNSLFAGSVDFDNFKDPDGEGTHVTSSSKVGPTIADDIKKSAFYAAIFALLLIFAYILLRFNRWQYSAGAVAALFHDTLIVLAFFSIFHGILPFSMEIDQAFIAAILTVIGYSINDTVVVFDRIREFMNSFTRKSKEEVINMAVNSTISRTVITSLTTLFVVMILLVFGGTSIKGFALALVIGIIVGTYSSVFVATPIMSDLSPDLRPKDGEGKKKKSFSKGMAKARR